ncbi:MAG: TetR/AcrR family transcriptional regulator, partial [Oleiphilaceae bacterium]|nr:TetR/AcrR family transcriptional regulator [Oleiphilaceae bacterium]
MESIRRQPIQERGKERYQLIIQATQRLVGSRGNDQVSIRDIAKAAGVAPSSIYQYFDDKHAIIVAIMSEYFDRSYELLAAQTSQANSLQEWVEAIENSVDYFLAMLQEDPGWATIWSGIQASPALREFDNQDAMRNATLLKEQLMAFCPHLSDKEALSACLLLVQTAGLTARMALFSDT